jgi:hypothetical protein
MQQLYTLHLLQVQENEVIKDRERERALFHLI